MIQLLLLLDTDWENARGYLREDLDHLQVAINALGGVTALGDLPAGTLIGRGSGSSGTFESITLGTGLTMAGTVLSSGASASTMTPAQVAARVALHV